MVLVNQFGTLVTMSVENVGGAQTGLGETLSRAGGKGISGFESAFQSNSGPADGGAWSGGMAAYDGDGIGTGSDKGAGCRVAVLHLSTLHALWFLEVGCQRAYP